MGTYITSTVRARNEPRAIEQKVKIYHYFIEGTSLIESLMKEREATGNHRVRHLGIVCKSSKVTDIRFCNYLK